MEHHPYYPRDAHIPLYQQNTTPLPLLLLTLCACIAAVITLTYTLAARRKPTPSPLDLFSACWFSVCGGLHLLFEGYYVLNSRLITGQASVPAQLWKEYALSDSRYLTRDVFTLCVETITVIVWGPLSLLAAASVVTGSPSRHFYQLVVCVAHLYGVALYYATNWLEHRQSGVSYSRPEFLYFWVYYVGFNLPWAVVPFGLLAHSFCRIREAFAALDTAKVQKKRM